MAVLLVMAVGCEKKHEISLSPTSYEFDPYGGELTVEITADGDWNVEKCPEWITATETSGSKNASIVLTAEQNLENAMREGVLEVSTADKSAQLQLSQGFVEEDYFSVLPDSLLVNYLGGEFDLQIISNCAWSLSENSQQISWISVSPMSGEGNQTVRVTVDRYVNSGDASSRQASLIFSSGLILAPVNVTQTNGSEVAVGVNPNSLRFVAEGGSQQINVTCSSSWTAYSTVEWLTVSATEGSYNGQITVTAESNEFYQQRLGAVIFTSDAGQNTTVTVVQDAAIDPHHLDVSPMEVNFTKQGGTAEITIGCDQVWKIDCPEHWLSFSSNIGEGDGFFEIVAEENILNTPRNAVVLVVSDMLEKRIQIHQEAGDEAPYVSLNIDTLYVDANETISTIEVFSNLAWTVGHSAYWTELLQNSGIGNGSFQLKMHANEDTSPRTCTLRISAPGAMTSLVIVQSGCVYTLETSLTEITAPADGMKTEISVSANQNWTVSKGASWIQYDPANGSNDGAFSIVIAPNISSRDRSAEIYVMGEKDGLVIISVSQSHAK